MTLIAAIDQGTTSTRCMLFDEQAHPVASAQREHRQIHPEPGWVEHDANEIWRNTERVIREVLERAGAVGRIAAVGITNQRETVVFWDRRTGEPLGNALVWQDTRTRELCDTLAAQCGDAWFRTRTGLPVAAYFSAPKIRWALQHSAELAAAARAGHARCGTMESWLVWKLTGGLHISDVTNASRTLLMNLDTLDWDDELLDLFGVPRSMLPRIVPNSLPGGYGQTLVRGPFARAVPICGLAGDQQAALVGQRCFAKGDAKNTYGTGCFLLVNAGQERPRSQHGLLVTAAYQLDGQLTYALEGSVAVAGALVQWLRDNLGLISESAEIEALAGAVPDNGGVHVVPAFSGLFAPHWDAAARGLIIGLTHQSDRRHIARAALEAVAFQVADVVNAVERDLGFAMELLRVDGGMVVNDLLMQLQADLLGKPVQRPDDVESTALGAALLAGMAAQVYGDTATLRGRRQAARSWTPRIDGAQRDQRRRAWNQAVTRAKGWLE